MISAPNLAWAEKRAPLFREAASEVGLDFQHFLGATGEYYLVEVMGPGVALFDYDNDGDLDVYFLQGRLLEPGKALKQSVFPPPPSHWPGHRLFRNELIPGGALRFTDVTGQAGVGHQGYGLGAAVGDYDNDGDKDLYVTNLGGNILYRNNGDGTFLDVTAKAGVGDEGFATSAAFLDFDRDGDLDLFVAHYNTFTIKGNKRCKAPTGERDYCGPTSYFPLPDRLYRNDGGAFRDVSQASGIGAATAAGLGIAVADYNGDGWLDIYVANDMTPNHLWINRQDGTFEETGLLSGSSYNQDGEVEAGMGVSAADFDGDGDEDLFVTNLRGQTNTLYLNDGAGIFDDATSRVGLDAPSVPYTGFGTQWFDYDNDGLLDLFVANGAIMMSSSLRGQPFPYHERNQLYRLEGTRFRETSAEAGKAFELSEVSRGAAFGDIDNDGDIDIVVTNCNGPARLLLNDVGSNNAWLQVAVEGAANRNGANRDGFGARVALLRKGRSPLWRRVAADGSYLSASSPRLHFGLGPSDSIASSALESIIVVWPNGQKETWPASKPNRLMTIKQGTGSPAE